MIYLLVALACTNVNNSDSCRQIMFDRPAPIFATEQGCRQQAMEVTKYSAIPYTCEPGYQL